MSKLTLTWCLAAAVVAGLPRTSGATNYHEYKKFPAEGQSNWNSSLPARSLSRCHVHPKERRYHYHCENQWEFWHKD